MKERPILFSGPMVRALLDGSKTQTRRIAKYPVAPHFCEMQERSIAFCEWEGAPCCGTGVWDVPYHSAKVPCPYGQPGDRLWVRETAKCGYRSEQPPSDTGRIGVDFKAGGSIDRRYTLDERDDYPWFPSRSHNADGLIRWAPAIHMPRWASRITLEVTGVRVERVQDISHDDALAEGVQDFASTLDDQPHPSGESPEQASRRLQWPQRQFRTLWESINGADSWNVNPWVWVVEFRRLCA